MPLYNPTSTARVLILQDGNGHGSTNTVIRRWTTTMTNTLTEVTYADSATNGMTITINSPGMYAMDYYDRRGGGAQETTFGISVNSAELTTSIGSITNATRLARTTAPNGEVPQVAITHYFASGDVIRCHTDGLPDSTVASTGRFSIRKVS